MKDEPLFDIRQYSPTMKISQVLKFCDKKNLNITRAMIQNYIRMGLLPPPKDKRWYTHNHLTILVLIDRLKMVFDIPTIQTALYPYMDDDGISLEVYTRLINDLTIITNEWEEYFESKIKTQIDGGILLSMVFATELKSSIV